MHGFSCAYMWRLVRHLSFFPSLLGSVSCAFSRKPPSGVSYPPSKKRPARCLVRIFSRAPERLLVHPWKSSCAHCLARPLAASCAPLVASMMLRYLEHGVTRAPGCHLMRGVSCTAVSFARRPTQASSKRCLVRLWQVFPTSTAIVLSKASHSP